MANVFTLPEFGADSEGPPGPLAVNEGLAARWLCWSDDRKIMFYDPEYISANKLCQMLVTQDVCERIMTPKDRAPGSFKDVRIMPVTGMHDLLPRTPEFGESNLMILAFG